MTAGRVAVSTSPVADAVAAAVTSRRTAGRIVVGVDGSAHAESALDWAAEEALRRQATLEVVHAWMPPYPLSARDLLADLSPLEDAAGGVLNAAVTRVVHRSPVPGSVMRKLHMGKAASTLVEMARDGDLLVVGSRGTGGFLGLPIGSVSRQCVTRAACPVVVVGSASKAVESARIVAGVDGSELSTRALRWAAHEAAMRGAVLEVVNASGPARSRGAVSRSRSSSRSASLALIEDMIDRAVVDLALRPRLVLQPMSGSAASALVEAATGAELLVVGVRGRGNVRDVLLGSVAQHCIEHSPCPVSVVHPDDEWRAP